MQDDRKARILASVDLPTLLLSHGIELRKEGQGYRAKCINHDDSNPSMLVYTKQGDHHCHCFSCGYHADTIGAYMTLTGADFPKAIDELSNERYEGKRFATIKDAPPIVKPERKVFPPPPDAGEPPWTRANRRQGDEWVSMGEPTDVWRYTTNDGATWYYEARYEYVTDDGEVKKEPRCWTWGQRGQQPARWELGFPPSPRPLYGLQDLATATQALVFEGPRKAAHARRLLNGNNVVACIAWPGGANAITKADWSPLEGLDVVLIPDSDEVGYRAIDRIAEQIKPASLKYVDTRDMDHAWDIADEPEWTKQDLLQFLRERKTEYTGKLIQDPVPPEPEPPQHTEPVPIEAYDSESHDIVWTKEPANLFEAYIAPKLIPGMLPKVVDDFVQDRAYIMDADPSFGGLACVTLAAGMLDSRIKIQVKEHDTWTESARLWSCLIGEPSSGKSPMQVVVTRPIDSLIERVAAQDREIQERHEMLDARYDKAWKKYKEACIESDDHDIPRPIAPKRAERLRVEMKSFTMEGLEEVLMDSPREIFINLDEMASLIEGFDAYRTGGSKKDKVQMLEAFNGRPFQKDVISRGLNRRIPAWGATILGGTQPSTIRKMSLNLDGDGFLSRFLVVLSNHVGGRGKEDIPNRAAINRWQEIVHHLWDIKHGGGVVQMSPEAMQIRIAAMSKISDIIDTGMISQPFISHLGKWFGVSARMILTFWAIECADKGIHPESRPVTPECADMAMRYMMQHLLPHAVSFYEDMLGLSEVGESARLIGGMIVAEHKTELTTTWLHKHGPSRWRQSNKWHQEDSLNRLVEYGWIAPANRINSATRRPTRYLVNPAVHTLFETHREREQKRINDMRDIGAKIRAGHY